MLVSSYLQKANPKELEEKIKTLLCLECSPNSLEHKAGHGLKISSDSVCFYLFTFFFPPWLFLLECISVIFPPLKKLYDLQGLQNTHKTGDSPVSMKSPNGIRSPELVANNGKGTIRIQWLILVWTIWLIVIFSPQEVSIFLKFSKLRISCI